MGGYGDLSSMMGGMPGMVDGGDDQFDSDDEEDGEMGTAEAGVDTATPSNQVPH